MYIAENGTCAEACQRIVVILSDSWFHLIASIETKEVLIRLRKDQESVCLLSPLTVCSYEGLLTGWQSQASLWSSPTKMLLTRLSAHSLWCQHPLLSHPVFHISFFSPGWPVLAMIVFGKCVLLLCFLGMTRKAQPHVQPYVHVLSICHLYPLPFTWRITNENFKWYFSHAILLATLYLWEMN
jgi:hypothetical protein